MKLSIVRTDKKGVLHLSVKTPEWLTERIKTDTKAGDIARLREHVAMFGITPGNDLEAKIARVCPLVELTKTDNDNLKTVAFNGLIWLHVAGLLRQEDIDAVKECSKILPTTFAAFQGADGRSVEILVSVARKSATQPATDEEIKLFCQKAYDVAVGVYNGVLPKAIELQAVNARDGFLLPLDEQPFFHPDATPLTVDDRMGTEATTATDEEEETEQREVDIDLYGDYELMYRRAADEAYEETRDVIESQRQDAYITELAHRLCLMRMPQEEAFLHIRNHHIYQSDYSEYTFRAIVDAVYAEVKPRGRKPHLSVAKETRL